MTADVKGADIKARFLPAHRLFEIDIHRAGGEPGGAGAGGQSEHQARGQNGTDGAQRRSRTVWRPGNSQNAWHAARDGDHSFGEGRAGKLIFYLRASVSRSAAASGVRWCAFKPLV